MSTVLTFPRSASAEQRVQYLEEQLARERKARRMADVLSAWDITSDRVLQFTPQQWEMCARGVEVHPPSELTRAMVHQFLRDREMARKAARP